MNDKRNKLLLSRMRRKESLSLNNLYHGMEGMEDSLSVNVDNDVEELETRRGSLRRRKDYYKV